jgi:hypothetical protein
MRAFARRTALRLAAAAVVLATVLVPLAARARANGPVDWNAVAATDTIEVVTRDPDGRPRTTTIWLAVHDGQGYVRGSGSRWLANLERDPDLLVRVGGEEHPLRAVKVSDSQTREAVFAVFREKYGLSDALISPLRSLLGTPTILRLEPRTSLAPAS